MEKEPTSRASKKDQDQETGSNQSVAENPVESESDVSDNEEDQQESATNILETVLSSSKLEPPSEFKEQELIKTDDQDAEIENALNFLTGLV